MLPFSKEGIDLGAQQQDDSKIVEERQQDDGKAYLSIITSQEIGDVEREEYEVYLQGDCCYHRPTPSVANADMLVGHNHVDRPE